MKLLSRSEEVVLLSIWKLQDNAYGVTIRQQVSDFTGKEWTLGTVYSPLHRLEKKGLVATSKGEPTAERGGRSKIYYQVTQDGKQALQHIKKTYDTIWVSIPSLGLNGQR
jgi:DNA-binding PadR family transcriptional regulator